MENILEQINTVRHEQIPDIAHDKFIQVYSQKFGEQNAEAFYEEQRGFFINELTSGSYKELLKEAKGTSIYFAFLFLAINNLSLEKGLSTTCYLECRSIKVGERTDDKGKKLNIYERNAVITVTGYGEIVLRQRAGQIRSVDNPKVVYDCDSFRYGERDGRAFVEYEKAIPRPAGAKIIACYVRIVKADGTTDYFVLDTDEMVRLRQYSGKSNWGKAKTPDFNVQSYRSYISKALNEPKLSDNKFVELQHRVTAMVECGIPMKPDTIEKLKALGITTE